VLDVGHGNCALALDEGWALMVDAAPSAAVIGAIEQLDVSRLDAVVISHRDYDHAGGVVPLLARRELDIGAVYIAADAAKNPTAPQTATLLAALHDAKRRGRCRVSRDLDAAMESADLSGNGIAVEVLAPMFATAMTGPKGKSANGGTLTSNSVSAVLRVTLSGGARVLLPGDLDDVALAELIAAGTDLSADILVFPHHGSHSAVADERIFAAEVMRQVRPSSVLFSVGRAAKARPTAEIVAGVFDADRDVYVACTQLSSGCQSDDARLPADPSEMTHLTTVPAAGRGACRSCAGSLTVAAGGFAGPAMLAHQGYLLATADTPMCHHLRPPVASLTS
jgi:competence protein ComEC